MGHLTLLFFIFAAGQATAPMPPSGPTMAETKSWLESEGPGIMRASRIQLDSRYAMLSIVEYRETNLTLDSCGLSWDHADTHTIQSAGQKTATVSKNHTLVPLKDLDVGAVAVQSDTILSDKPVLSVRIKTTAAVGSTIKVSRDAEGDKTIGQTWIYVRSQDDGDRVVKAIRRAAVLCGAPAPIF